MSASLFSSYLATGLPAFFPATGQEARVARVRAAVRPVAPEMLPALSGPVEKLTSGAAAVVTGQQIGLFLGPLYSVYKAATAVAAAEALERESGRPCVPVYWLQTEDHDFAEIAAISILPSRVLQLPREDARISVGCRRLGPEVSDLVAGLGECLAGQPHAGEVMDLFAGSYREDAPMAEAFRGAMARIFPELVFVDPRRLPAAPLFERALQRAPEIERALQVRGDELRAAGFDEQVRPRPGYTLVFHHPDGPDGPRYRLAQGERGKCFSSSALLRPILQDWALPTAAYVGGPGEIAYLAQATALYPLFELDAPMILPRARFRLVPPAAQRLLQQLGIAPADAEDAGLLARLAPAAPPGPERTWLAELEARLDGYAGDQRDVKRARRSFHHAIDRLARRHRRAALARDTTLADRVRRLKEWLFPGGAPQERVFGVPWFAAHSGITSLRREILTRSLIFNDSVKDVVL
jgi:bacillithiol synthase